MLRTLSFVVFLFVSSWVNAQEIVISTLSNALFTLDLSDCSLEQIGAMSIGTTDISFHPNGNLYAITSSGTVHQIDILTGGATLVHTFLSNQFFTALTISAEGFFYAAGLQGELHQFDLDSGQGLFLGNTGFGAEGDLTFYEGELYMAASDDQIVRVDTNNPANSIAVIDENIPGRIFGIVSYAATCQDVAVYALTDQAANIYEVDLVNNTMSLYCSIPLEASGGASTFEFLGSNPIDLSSLATADFDCATASGTITAEAAGGVGELTYSLDGINYQINAVFANLPVGDYTLYVADEVGCVIEEEVDIEGLDLIITEVTQVDASCGLANGRITLTVEGGTPPYALLVNQQPVFSLDINGLAPGFYTLEVFDQEGCSTTAQAALNGTGQPIFTNVQVVNAACGLAAGSLSATVSGGLGPFQYTLSGSPILNFDLIENLAPGSYQLQAEDAAGCLIDTLLEIMAQGTVSLDSIVVLDAICATNAGAISVFANSPNGELMYALGAMPLNTAPSFSNVPSGTYEVLVQDAAGCELQQTLTVGDSPVVTVAAAEIEAADCNTNNGLVTLNVAGGTGGIELLANNQLFAENEPLADLPAGLLSVVAIDSLGCTDTLAVTIPSGICPIYLPNIFSPNRDGVNDDFYPQATANSGIQVLRFQIYNRWGGQVFVVENVALTNAQLRWNGRRQGEDMPTGTYTYFLEVLHGSGQQEVLSGEVVLLR